VNYKADKKKKWGLAIEEIIGGLGPGSPQLSVSYLENNYTTREVRGTSFGEINKEITTQLIINEREEIR